MRTPDDVAPEPGRGGAHARSAMDCAAAHGLLMEDQRAQLDPYRADALAAHVAACPACAREDQAERLLTEQLERHLPQHAAPLALKRHLAAQWTARAAPPGISGRARRAAALAAIVLSVLAAATGAALWVGRPGSVERLVAEAVNDHLRVLARAGALDVQSADVHQLRPWLTGRLDFAPVIPFGGDAEFPLRGGSIEYFLDRRAAVAVYGRRLHTVTLIVARADGLRWPGGPLAVSARGFNVRLWQVGELGYALVSDTAGADLARLAARLGG